MSERTVTIIQVVTILLVIGAAVASVWPQIAPLVGR